MEVDGKVVLAPLSDSLSKSNPYVGNFHYGHKASKKLSGKASVCRKNSPPQEPVISDDRIPNSPVLGAPKNSPAQDAGVVANSTSYSPNSPLLAAHQSSALASDNAGPANHRSPFDDVDVLSTSPFSSPLLAAHQSPQLSRSPFGSVRKGRLSHAEERSRPITMEDRNKIKEALRLQSSVPADPEMCGLQALLPRQAGIQVQYKIGEGSFGKCVKVMNRKNRHDWSKGTSKRGIERHLNEIPREGDSLVIKYIKKDDLAAYAALYPDLDTTYVQCAVQREIRIHGKCSHPNIVRLFGHYELGSKVGLILGFVQGAELNDVLHVKRTLPEQDCFVIMLQLLRAAEYMHSIHIIHRDLKPRNVLVSSRLRVHVIDLGLAIDLSDPLDSSMQASSVVGTQGYMPPESWIGRPATFAYDMWALGVMLYEMAYGYPPFLAHELMLPSPVEFPDESWGFNISANLKDLLSQLLDKNGSRRVTARNALAHAWYDEGKVAAADEQLKEAADEELVFDSETVSGSVQEKFSEEVIHRISQRISEAPGDDEGDGEDPDCPDFSYAYYHAIIVQGGRNDLG